MPVERQAERVRTPLGPRDRRVLKIAAVAAVLGLGGGVFAAVDGTSSKADATCVVVTLPSTMGGTRIERCGSDAARLCRSDTARDPAVADACRRHGYKLPS